MVTNIFVSTYQSKFKPLKTIYQNYLETTNEYLIFVLTLFLVPFTEYIPNAKMRYEIGEYQIMTLGFYIFINMIAIFY